MWKAETKSHRSPDVFIKRSGAWMRRGSPCVMCVKVTDSLSLSPSAYTRLWHHLLILARVGERVVPFRWRLKWLIVTSLFVSPPPALSGLSRYPSVSGTRHRRERVEEGETMDRCPLRNRLGHASWRVRVEGTRRARDGVLQGWNKGVF